MSKHLIALLNDEFGPINLTPYRVGTTVRKFAAPEAQQMVARKCIAPGPL